MLIKEDIKIKLSLLEKHIYKAAFTIKSKEELAEKIINNELYNRNGIIALPKPFGIQRKKIQESTDKITVTQTLNSAAYVSSISIEEIMPLLKKHYNVRKLSILYYPERYTSGIMLLSHSDTQTNRIINCFKRSLAFNQPHQTFVTILRGKPSPEDVKKKVGLSLQYVPNIGKIPQIIQEFSKRKMKRALVKSNVVEQKLLAYNEELDVSLTEISVLNLKNHFLRVWAAHCYAPVLGDLICAGRVKTVLGKKIQVSINNISGYQPPILSDTLLKKLYLNQSQVELIPTHIHQSQLKLHWFFRRESTGDLVVHAPPPEHFMWTCSQLSLIEDEGEYDEEFDEDFSMDDSIETVPLDAVAQSAERVPPPT